MSAADGNALLSDVIGESADRLSAVVPASPSVAGIVAAGGAIMEEAGRSDGPLTPLEKLSRGDADGGVFCVCAGLGARGCS